CGAAGPWRSFLLSTVVGPIVPAPGWHAERAGGRAAWAGTGPVSVAPAGSGRSADRGRAPGAERAAVAARRQAAVARELLPQLRTARVADLGRDLLDGQVRGLQQLCGACQALRPQPGVRRGAGGGAEAAGERPAAHQAAGRQLVHGDPAVQLAPRPG